jgi:ABC-type transport system involved in cytochrome c biogenesis permease component
MALAALAWLTLVLGLRSQRRTKAVAALPSLATVLMALVVAIGDAANGEDDLLPGILLLAIELSALIAFAVIWAWQPEVDSGSLTLI